MRPLLILLSAVLAFAPISFIDSGDGDAHAKSRKRSKKKTVRQKPEIKLRDAPPPGGDEPAPTTSAPPQRGPTRIDFDDRLVQGQTNRSGSVYLYDRKELKSRSMVKKRESFREEIVRAVYDEDSASVSEN